MNKKILLGSLTLLTVLALGGWYLAPKKSESLVYHTNPQPITGYAISIDQVDPGNKVEVNSLDTEKSVYLSVIKDGKNQTELGRSELLAAGNHGKVNIELKSMLMDGDVVFVRLIDSNGKIVTNSNMTNVEVKKNVGMVMSHYQNEY